MSRIPGGHSEALPITPAQRDELERRWHAFEQHPDDGESWEDVRQSLLEDAAESR